MQCLPVCNRTRIAPPLDVLMATVAERHQVRERVRLSVPCNLVETERADVMHVERMTEKTLCDPASLARVTVSTSSLTCLTLPVRAVVLRMTASPRRIASGAPVERAPCAETLAVAERLLAVSCGPHWSNDDLCAVATRGRRDASIARRLLTHETTLECCPHARLRTVRSSTIAVRRRAIEGDLAVSTRQHRSGAHRRNAAWRAQS